MLLLAVIAVVAEAQNECRKILRQNEQVDCKGIMWFLIFLLIKDHTFDITDFLFVITD